jgi:GTPase
VNGRTIALPMTPKIVIVGRPNVGKSSLLNLLAGRRVSIVDATPGVTRDRVSTRAVLPAGDDYPRRAVELIDTGGHGIEDVQDLTTQVEAQIARGLGEASLVLFVIDAQVGVQPLDNAVARLLRGQRGRTPVLLVANKVDGPTHEPAAQEAFSLGFGEPAMVSATTGHHKRELIERVSAMLNNATPVPGIAPAPGSAPGSADGDNAARSTADAQADTDADEGLRIAIVGKRNAGKSTLVNTLAGEERVIVSEVEGTTRDAIDVHLTVSGHVFTLIDTAGVRKRKSMQGDVEFYSYHRAMRSVRRADVVLLLIDATLPISQVDKQLALEIVKHHKPCVVVINKWDLAQAQSTQDEYTEYLDDALKGLSFAPIAFVSALKNEGTRDLLAMALNLHRQAGHRVTTGVLNRLVEQVIAEHTPPSKQGKRPRIYYVTQLAVHPPTIGLFVNDPDLFDGAYERYLLNRLRDELPYSEVPIKLLIRAREKAAMGSEK